MRRPALPLDPADAPEYERDMDAYEKYMSELEDREWDMEEKLRTDEPLNDKEDE